MLATYRVAARGLVVELTRHEVLANNIANARTPGFQPDEVVISAAARSGAGAAPTTVAGKTASLPEPEITGTYTRAQPGGMRRTDNPMDFAVRGDGYFVVDTPDGPALTRGGSFLFRQDGTLVTASGHAVQGAGGPISTNAQRIQVNAEGEVAGDGAAVDRLAVRAVRPGATLVKTRDGLVMPAGGDADLVPATDYEVHQGYIEDAAVEPVREMVDMINAFRAYEAGIRSIQASDDMLRTATDRLGRLV